MYHFIGIKGAGMSSLANIMNDLGYEVKGSDIEKHFFTEIGLNERNIKITVYDKSNIYEGLTIIKGASITDDNVELMEAKRLNLEIITYEEMVGRLTTKFKTICVSGCHGKTTTTAMLSITLPSTNYLIGDGTGFAKKDNTYFALESCEYKRHFLNYTPYYLIITNIDLDHVDYFKDIDDVIDAYNTLANKAVKKVVMYGDDPYTRKMKLDKEPITYGLSDNNDVIAKNIEYNANGIKFDVYINDTMFGKFDLPLYGEHQLLDSLSVITVCYLEGMDSNTIQSNLSKFKGAKRRFSEVLVNDSIIIDDYAHHPNEIKATMEAVKQKYPNKDIVAIFQPHTFTRTEEFASDIAKYLNIANSAYVLDIHPAREKQEDYPNVTSNIIIDKLNNGYHLNITDAEILSKHKGSVYVFMSPNDLSILENELKELL